MRDSQSARVREGDKDQESWQRRAVFKCGRKEAARVRNQSIYVDTAFFHCDT
jgi:hypothetical protein